MKKLYTGQSLMEAFNHYKDTPSDINEHMETLLEYGKKCSNIVEMGVRTGRSTTAWLMACPRKLLCIDLKKHKMLSLEKYIQWAKKQNISFEFIVSNSIKSNIPKDTELLFIDTYHTYELLSKELEIHHDNVSKYIILHDTETFGTVGEDGKKPGLIKAVSEFRAKNPQWQVEKVYLNNNGLTILKRG